MKSRLCAILMLGGIMLFPQARAETWPALEAPPKSRVEWVGKDMKLNGVPMRIQRFEADAGVGEVLGFYRAHWGSQSEKKSVENALGKWQIIGRQLGQYYMSVQVQPTGLARSAGYLSVSMLPDRKRAAPVAQQFPMMAGSRALSELESTDPGQTARTITLVNGYSVESNASFYKEKLAAQDWQLDKGYGGPQQNGNAYAMFFRRKKEEATVIVSKVREGTSVVANVVSRLDAR